MVLFKKRTVPNCKLTKTMINVIVYRIVRQLLTSIFLKEANMKKQLCIGIPVALIGIGLISFICYVYEQYISFEVFLTEDDVNTML